MKILIATGIYPPDIGGPATYSSLLYRELPKRGISVEIVTYGEAGVSMSIPKGVRHILYFYKCLKLGRKADVIFAQDTVSAGLPALLAAKMLNKKFFVRVPGDYAWEQGVQRFGVKESIDEFQSRQYGWQIKILRIVQRMVVGGAEVVITPSHYFKTIVSQWLNNSDKIKVIYNGIELVSNNFVKNQNFNYQIVSVGRLVPWKGFSKLIQLMRELPNWQLTIVGDGPDRELLEAQTKELSLSDRVNFVGSVSPVELQNIYNKSSVFILNTKFESFSFALVEALQAGLFCIATNVGNLKEIMKESDEGVFFEPDDLASLKKIIKQVENDQEWYYKIVANGKKRAEFFSINKTLDELDQLFKKIVK